MGNICTGSICTKIIVIPVDTNLVDEEFLNKIREAVGDAIVSIPIEYVLEQDRIVNEMHQASPNSYQGLLYGDYPTKNKSQVSALARRNVTSDQIKEQITNEVNEALKSEIESKINGLNPIARAATEKAIETAIEIVVNQAVNSIVLDDDKTSTTKK